MDHLLKFEDCERQKFQMFSTCSSSVGSLNYDFR